ncbi:MAG: hypothetical protein R6V40_00925 [Candidatus Moraniibacteriota bacterium]
MYKESQTLRVDLQEIILKASKMKEDATVLYSEKNEVYFITNNPIISNELSLLLMNLRIAITVKYHAEKRIVLIKTEKKSEKIIKDFIRRKNL